MVASGSRAPSRPIRSTKVAPPSPRSTSGPTPGASR
jgi:hypothetical protein